MESYFPELVVKELLDEVVTTYEFPGYKNLDVSLRDLEQVYKTDSPAWKNALSIKGIYLITDMKKNKTYVGKASGGFGIWQRWCNYITDGHGGDVALKELMNKEGGLDYARENYKFTLLEITNDWDENYIDARESYWKNVLMSRLLDNGYNRN